MNTVRTLEVPPEFEQRDPEHVAWLAEETVSTGHSVLIFCASKAACEACAKHCAKILNFPERRTNFAVSPGLTGRWVHGGRAWLVVASAGMWG